MNKILNKLLGKKDTSIVKRVDQDWHTDTSFVSLPLPKEYSSSKERRLEIQLVKRSDSDKFLLQVQERTVWGHTSDSVHERFSFLLSETELKNFSKGLSEAVAVVTKEEK